MVQFNLPARFNFVSLELIKGLNARSNPLTLRNNIVLVLFAVTGIFNPTKSFCQLVASNDTAICDGGTATLLATVTGAAGTNSYTFEQIPFAPEPLNGTNTVTMTDDDVDGPFPVGFDFCFLGGTYSEFYIGSNGWISFTPGQPTSYTSASIPNTAANVPKNAIMGPWQDWHPGLCNGACINYETYGTAPNRKLVVTWDNVPMFSCTTVYGTFQIVCNETSGIIDNHLINKPNCPSWANGSGTEGVHNDAGTIAYTAPGRNSTQWTASNESIRFVPSGVEWYQGATLVGVGDSISVNPTIATTYTATVSLCDGNTYTDDVLVEIGNVDITVDPMDASCFGYADGFVEIDPVGSLFPVSLGLLDENQNVLQTVNGVYGIDTLFSLLAGNYTATVTDGVGCTTELDFVIDQPTLLQANADHLDILCNGDDNGTAWTYPSGSVPPYQFQWTDPLQQITDSIGFLAAGAYTLTVTDAQGCTDDTTLSVLEPLPLILDLTSGADTCLYTNGAVRAELQGGTPPYAYDWDNLGGDSANYSIDLVNTAWSMISNLSSGEYAVTVTDSNNCEIAGSMEVPLITPPVADFLSRSKPQEFVDPDVLFDNQSSASISYEWHFGDGDISYEEDPEHAYDTSGVYLVMLVAYNDPEYGCADTAFQYIDVEPFFTFYVPSGFTPDDDGTNDTWGPLGQSFEVESYNVKIYDRWGTLIWQTDNPDKRWDGTMQSSTKDVPQGMYVYVFTMKKFNTFEPKVIKGTVTLYRHK